MKRKLTLFVTNDCNLNCSHCYLYLKKDYFNFNTYMEIINQGWDEVTFTGGEALLHPYIWNMIHIAHRKNISIRLLTNGILLDEKNIHELKRNNVQLFISYDKSRQYILEKINLAVQNNLKVGINHVLTEEERFILNNLPEEIDSICLIYPTHHDNAIIPIYDSLKWNELLSQALSDYIKFIDKIIYEPAFINKNEYENMEVSCLSEICTTVNVFGERVICCLLLDAQKYQFNDIKDCPVLNKQAILALNGTVAICPLLLRYSGNKEIW